MPVPPTVFARPDHALLPLDVDPRLDCWERSWHPDQMRLQAFLTHAVQVLMPALSDVADPLALRLDVGLKPDIPLLDAHDLDNYVFPLTMRLTNVSRRQIACVWATKRHASQSLIGIEQARALADGEPPHGWLLVHTTASSVTTAYKQQIHDALQTVVELPRGPISLQVAFTVGPGRNWPNLWKPTIDALGRLLGYSGSATPWHPQDGRIVELGLHRQVDPSCGHGVRLAIASRPHGGWTSETAP
jgi:hypothetical protein